MLSQRSIGAAGVSGLSSDEEFNTVSFLSHFDGTNNGTNNVFDDSSSSNHTITANGNVTQGSFGPFARSDGEWAVSFDGSGDRVRANWAENVGTSDFTIEAWVFIPSDMDQYDCIAWLQEATHGSAGDNGFFIRANGSNTIEFAVLSFSTVYNTISSAISFGEWHHLSLSKSGTTMYSSVDGTVTSRSAPSGINNSKYLNIGAADANGSVSYSFNGIISNVRFVVGTALYTSSFTPSTSPLTAITNTKFLGCQSNRFVDNSANNYTVSTSGDAAVSAFSPFLTSSVYDAGVNGASAYFDGSDKLSSSASTDYEFGTGDLTVEYWAYPTASGAIQNILDNRAEASGWKLGRDASNRFQLYNEVTASYLFESGTFPENAWSHFCWTRASGVNKFFINGVQSGSNVSDSSNFNSNSLNIGVQHGGDSQYFTGYITCCRVIKGTAVEPSGVPTSPPTAVTNTKLLLNMADGQAIDSAAQNNLTLFGNAKINNTQSKFGGTSMVFDATANDKVDLGQAFLDDGNWTCEFWIYLNASTDITRVILGQYEVVDGRCIFQYLGASNEIHFFIGGTGGNSTIKASMSRTAWHHVAVTKDGDNYKLFVDGAVGASGTATVSLHTGVNTHLGPNNFTGDKGIAGYIDDLRISKSVRYTTAFTPPTEPFADKGQ